MLAKLCQDSRPQSIKLIPLHQGNERYYERYQFLTFYFFEFHLSCLKYALRISFLVGDV